MEVAASVGAGGTAEPKVISDIVGGASKDEAAAGDGTDDDEADFGSITPHGAKATAPFGGTSDSKVEGKSVPSGSAKASPASTPTAAGGRPQAAAKALTKTKVALPHHIAPLSSGKSTLGAKLEKMREEMGGDAAAPWDPFGRPKLGALGAKK